jgi:hypothetical protein
MQSETAKQLSMNDSVDEIGGLSLRVTALEERHRERELNDIRQRMDALEAAAALRPAIRRKTRDD